MQGTKNSDRIHTVQKTPISYQIMAYTLSFALWLLLINSVVYICDASQRLPQKRFQALFLTRGKWVNQRSNGLLFQSSGNQPLPTLRQNSEPSVRMSASPSDGTKFYTRIIGAGSMTPPTLLTNEDLERQVETSDDWITKRTGISRRHVLSHGESLSGISTHAAKRALADAKLSAEDLDMVILATSTPDDLFGDAAFVANAIGARRAVGWDLTAACSGFLFGLVTASQFIENGAFNNVMIIGADAMSKWVDWEDRSTCILFGDGAGAVVCQSTSKEEEHGLLGWSLHSDGSRKHHLSIESDLSSHSLKTEKHIVNSGNYHPVKMSGKEVFLFATREVPIVIEEALKKAGISKDQVDWILLHQANIRIMNAVTDRLKMPRSKLLSNLKEYGNTSAASIPLCLHEAIQSGKVKNGDVIVAAGFGAGLSWGASVIRWGGS